MKLFNLEIDHRKIYFIGLILVAICLPISKFALNVAMITLAINWLLEGRFHEKYQKLKSNPGILIICGVFLIHLLWLLNTSNFQYAFHDLKNKLIIIVFPLIIGTSEILNKNQFKQILIWFSLAVVVSTLISAAVLFGILDYPVNDIRDISMFMSHIRLSLLINVGIFSLAYFLFSAAYEKSKIEVIIYGIFILWLIVFLFLLKSFSGIIIFFILFFLLSGYYSFKIQGLIPRLFLQVLLITGFLFIASYTTHAIARFYSIEKVDFENMDTYTVSGNLYHHSKKRGPIENGHYVGLYVCQKELENEWKKISEIPYDGYDKKGQKIKSTLIRYLTSKGYRKDSVGISKLNLQDIENIENGIANYIYSNKFALYPHIYRILWEFDVYKKGFNPAGNSITQRLEFLKTATDIIKNNFWFGTGTGDVKAAFDHQYEINESQLPQSKRLRAHNQYVTFFLAFGFLGFVFIWVCILYPPLKSRGFKDYFFVMFFMIAMISMLNEDTLETQIGVTFFSYFYALFLFGKDLKLQDDYE
ncbi:MAG: O-antigen ligase family protein [Bacteroidota bacterium]